MNTRLYDRNFALVFASNGLFVTANALLVHFARWVAFLGGDERDIGWIFGIGAISAVLLRPWVGRWVDRVGARNTWSLGYAVFIVTTLAFPLIGEIGPAIYGLRVLAVLAPALVFTSNLTYLGHTTPPVRLAEAIGSLGVSGFIGMMAGPFLGDVFLGDGDRTRADFVWLFGTAAALVLGSLVILLLLKATPPHPGARQADFFPAIRRHWPGQIMLVLFVFGICLAVPFAFLAKFVDAIGIGSLSVFFAFYAGWAIVLRIVFRTLPQRIGRRRLVLIGMGFMVAGLLSYLLVDRAWMLAVPAILCGTAHSFTFPAMIALAVQVFPAELRGTGSAIALMAVDGGIVVGAPLLGSIAFYVGYDAMFECVSGMCALVMVIFWARAFRVT